MMHIYSHDIASIFFTTKIKLSPCHYLHIDTPASGPGTSQPENMAEFRQTYLKCSRELVRCRSRLFWSGCNRCTKLPKSFMRPLPWSNEQQHGQIGHSRIVLSLTPTLALIPGIPSWLCCIAAQTQKPFQRTKVFNILPTALLSHAIMCPFC